MNTNSKPKTLEEVDELALHIQRNMYDPHIKLPYVRIVIVIGQEVAKEIEDQFNSRKMPGRDVAFCFVPGMEVIYTSQFTMQVYLKYES